MNLRADDQDFLELLPALETIDALVVYYFEYCNWINRHSGSSPDRVFLATVCMIMAIAVHYLPDRDPLIAHLADSHEGTGKTILRRHALDRHCAESRTYTLELVECLLIRCHYLTLNKTDSEEIWAICAELVSMGIALGLHRDPNRWKMSKEVAERKRWAWWHIILLERWQAFMFGRLLAVASHHFDTTFPSVHYSLTPTNTNGQTRLYAPNLALFRLVYILGDIMDSAISLRPVPYETVLSHDKHLTSWMESLPPELDLGEFGIARALASPDTVVRRLGVQSIIIRTSYYHIRFTHRRPYAPFTSPLLRLDTAVGSADKLITLVDHARPDFLANASLAVPGHMSWGPFHVLSAATFFSFQFISNQNQPGTGLFRVHIKKALGTLDLSRGQAVADRALDILGALQPLYEGRVLGLVKTLAFPYHDQARSLGWGSVSDSPNGGYASGSPSGYAVSPPGYATGSPNHMPGVFGSPGQRYVPPSTSPPMPYPYPDSRGYSDVRGSYDDVPPPPLTTQPRNPYPVSGSSSSNTYPTGQAPSQGYSDSARSYPTSSDTKHSIAQQTPYPDSRPYPSMGGSSGSGNGPYPYPYQALPVEGMMWGASLSQPEWVRFLDVMQRPPGERG
ncbi:hypothetical protein M405DRAFT_853651 [Rhizopogon salebrosus TDB-379]|nr:hypothetical protein M405DRAFT_853651 [Rhizopogon salebrosus TDB-379]